MSRNDIVKISRKFINYYYKMRYIWRRRNSGKQRQSDSKHSKIWGIYSVKMVAKHSRRMTNFATENEI